MILFGPKLLSKILCCPHNQRALPMRSLFHVNTGLPFFKICHSVEFNIIVRATMPMNPYDDLTVSMRRQHGKGDLDIVRAL